MLTAADLLAPQGEIEPELFPDETPEQLEQRLSAYLAQAYARAEMTDEAAEQWALHRAYKAVYTKLSAIPTGSSTDGQGSATFHHTQAVRFLELSNAYLDTYQALLAPAPAPQQVARKPGGTTAVQTRVRW